MRKEQAAAVRRERKVGPGLCRILHPNFGELPF
jgi:hypothetical protein